MSLFGFGDIQFKKLPGSITGPLKSLEESGFDTKTFRYPSDLGNTDKGHYVVFYIREQKNSSFSSPESQSTSSYPQSTQLPTNLAEKYGNEVVNKINSMASSINSTVGNVTQGITGTIQNSINSLFTEKTNFSLGTNTTSSSYIIDNSIKQITDKRFIQTTRLTKGAIALYMPDTLLFKDQQSYDGLRPGNQFLLGQSLAAARSAVDEYRRNGGGASGETAGGAAITKSGILGTGSAISGLGGDVGKLIFTGVSGVVVNPMLELVYSSPNFRTFDFQFLFYPRDEKEAFQVQEIINEFRFHQAPEIVKDAQGFLIPPSEFDIKFYYGGKQNPNLQQISTCVLANINVDYAPNGFVSYEVDGQTSPRIGGTGMPVAIRLDLEFQEVTYLTKQDFRDTQNDYVASSQSGQYGTT
jgi:hypothetical protein